MTEDGRELVKRRVELTIVAGPTGLTARQVSLVGRIRGAVRQAADIKVTKKQSLTVDRFESFFELLPSRADSERSWTLSRDEIEARNFDLKAVNPNAEHRLADGTRQPVPAGDGE